MHRMIRVAALFLVALFLGLSIPPAPLVPPAAAQGADSNTADEPRQPPPKRSSAPSTGTQLATSELVRIEQQAQLLNQRLSELSLDAQAGDQAERLLPRLAPLRQRASAICANPDDSARADYFDELTAVVEEAGRAAAHRPGPWQAWPPSEGFCQRTDFPATVLGEIDSQLSAMRGAKTEREVAEKQLEDLNERREEVLREMSEDLAGTSVADNIPWLMLIIFGVGAATLAGLKLFDQPIQQELVASGQIVQFVTILILLGVILALGLAQRLQAETLGTLLGGLAGYVLSQGVGRQAKQQALNELKTAAGMVAPPPPPPPPPAPVA